MSLIIGIGIAALLVAAVSFLIGQITAIAEEANRYKDGYAQGYEDGKREAQEKPS